MPKPRRAKSLTEICLQLVASHLTNFNPDVRSSGTTSAISEEQKLNSKSVLVQLDLEKLPQQFIEKVIEALRTNKWLSIKRHCDLLTTKSTKLLDFSYVFPSEAECPPKCNNDDSESNSESIVQLLQLAATRCPKLTHLLMGANKAKVSCFLECIPLFQYLQVLDVSLSGEHFDDRCLHLLGINCHNLRELDVSYCNVTDDGIKGLCGSTSDVLSQVLCKLSIIGNPAVTDEGAQIVLRHVPHLKILNYERLVQALADMENVSTRPEYALTKLMSAKQKDGLSSQPVPPYSYRNGALPMAVSLCPSITELCLHLHGITDSELLSVRVLENLRELKLENERDAGTSRITFNYGLAPLLKDVGSSLKSLELEYLAPLSIHVEELVEYCPNLVRLSIDWCYCRTSTDINELAGRWSIQAVWKHLRELNLSSRIDVLESTDVMMPAESLILFLASSPALRELSLVACEFLNDDVLRRVFQCHSFSFLEVLKLQFCDMLTRGGIDLFMNDGNNLKKFESDCALLTVQDLMELEFEAKQQNWDLKVVSLFEYYYTEEDF